jgi:hypothetical protein
MEESVRPLDTAYVYSDQKRERVEKASALLTRLKDRYNRRLRENVKEDETWLYFIFIF